jgi:hypothetical protein
MTILFGWQARMFCATGFCREETCSARGTVFHLP